MIIHTLYSRKKMVAGITMLAMCVTVLTACRQPMAKKLERSLLHANIEGTKLFGYNLDMELIPTQSPQGDLITVTAHGYGANKESGYAIAQYAPLTGHVLTFNLPDYDFRASQAKDRLLTHGSINELLPFLYALKTVIDAGAPCINLYGFSAGGGVIINVLAVLNSNRFDTELKRIGITTDDKRAIRKAIEQGVVLLDAPLKSVEEIIEGRGTSPELELFAQRYTENKLRPIDSLSGLQGLQLNIVLYFETPDEILYNRDDTEFINRLKQANSLGTTCVVFGKNGGHVSWHKELWKAYLVTK